MHSRVLRRTIAPLAVLLPLLGLLGASMIGCGRGAHADTIAKPAAEPAVLKAAVLTIQPTSWPTVVRTQGSLIADEVTIVGAKVAGRVKEVNFDLGDAVQA